MTGDVCERPAGCLDGRLVEAADGLRPTLGLLDGWTERLGQLGVPVAQVYVRAAETSLSRAILAIERARVAEGWTASSEQNGIDPRLAEWLD